MSSGNSIKRQDGRSDTEIREIEIAFNELERADGSARFAFGTSLPLYLSLDWAGLIYRWNWFFS